MDFNEVEKLLEEAVEKKYNISLRISSLPQGRLDSELTTRITDYRLDEKVLQINMPNLRFMFEYESCCKGTESEHHKKFYLKSNEVILTVNIQQ